MLVDFARLPESFSDLDSLEKWLEGYDNDKFDPENALVNVLYAQNETEGQLTNDSLDRPKTMNLVVKPKNLEKIEIGFIALGVKEERGKLKRMYDIINVRLNLGSTKDYKSTIEDAVKKNKKAGFTYAADLHKSIHITSEDNAVNGEYRISITNDATSLGKDLTKNIYAVKIGVVAEDFEPFQSSLYRLSYKYRDNIYAKSSSDSYILKSAGRNKTVETTRLPIFMEKRYEPIKFNFDFSYESLSSCTANTFKPLIEELQKKFEEKLAALSLLSRRKATRDDLHSERIKREFDNDAKRLKLELNATASGVTLLAADSDLLKAFRMLNSAFAERYKSEHKRDSNYKNSEWRSFQLTFLLAQLSSVFNNEKTLVLLNFPTGMVKTEAFVGLSILKIIYERLTKTNHGTSVVIKYPRKLLSRQQLKRALSLVTFANAVLFNGANQVYQHPISLGALFNSEDSPNRYIDAGSGYRYTTKEFQDWKRDPDGEKRAIILEKCPYCNEDITVVVDDLLLRIKFLCKNNDCFFYKNEAGKFLERGPGELPLYIGDDEVFRYLPSILITTIDKFSSFASNNPNFKTLFLESRTVLDSRYGFYFTDKHFKYFQKSRSGNETTWDFFHEYFKAPTLFVFDEIHLINGAYASKLSVIENAFMTLFSKIPGGKEPHILCSSATVCQIFNDDGLFAYQSDMARMFIVPPDKVTLYPVFWDIFVKQEPDYRRLITAVMPCNFSHYLAIEHVSGYYFNKFREIPVEYKKYYSTFL